MSYKLAFYNLTVLLTATAAALSAQADPLGRLFTTAQERAALDSESTVKFASRDEVEKRTARRLLFNGSIKSSRGKQEVWLDGKNLNRHPDSIDGGARLLNNGRVRLETGYLNRSLTLKPGQVLDLDDGQVYESFMVKPDPADKPAGG